MFRHSAFGFRQSSRFLPPGSDYGYRREGTLKILKSSVVTSEMQENPKKNSITDQSGSSTSMRRISPPEHLEANAK